MIKIAIDAMAVMPVAMVVEAVKNSSNLQRC